MVTTGQKARAKKLSFSLLMKLGHLRPECEACISRKGGECDIFIRPDRIAKIHQDARGKCLLRNTTTNKQ
jgi:hypothetical protein